MGDDTPQNMTKADLVDLIYERIGSSKKEACEIVEEVFKIIEESLQRGEKVKISGFGNFVINEKRPEWNMAVRKPASARIAGSGRQSTVSYASGRLSKAG